MVATGCTAAAASDLPGGANVTPRLIHGCFGSHEAAPTARSVGLFLQGSQS